VIFNAAPAPVSTSAAIKPAGPPPMTAMRSGWPDFVEEFEVFKAKSICTGR
jgi:hypothetical protein